MLLTADEAELGSSALLSPRKMVQEVVLTGQRPAGRLAGGGGDNAVGVMVGLGTGLARSHCGCVRAWEDCWAGSGACTACSRWGKAGVRNIRKMDVMRLSGGHDCLLPFHLPSLSSRLV